MMLPRSRLCAQHFSNHLVVQELLLHASLGRNRFSPDDGKAYLELARLIAQLNSFCGHAINRKCQWKRSSVKTPWSHPAARHVVVERVRQQVLQQAKGKCRYILSERKVPVFYDDAVGHQKRLQQLLGPHGYSVALTGIMSRGCPLAPRAEFLLTRGVQDDCCGDIAGQNSNENKNNHDNGDSGLQILFERALSGLVASGYLKSFAKRRVSGMGGVVRRYVCLARLPAQCGPEPLLCSGEALQELVFFLSLPQSFYVNCLFLTGPTAFLAHLMLLAHDKGFELLHDGLYRLLRDARELVAVKMEEDIFTILGLPYVDPFCRYAYCRLNKLL